MAQLSRQEVESLNQSRELFDGGHYDLSVVEAWRALEARLRQVLLNRRISTRTDDPQAVIHAATRKGILKEPTLGVVSQMKRNWNVAVSTDPLPREAAVESLSALRHVLSVIPVKEPASATIAQPSPTFDKSLAHV